MTGRDPAGHAGHLVALAGTGDADALCQVIADAFHPLAVSQWLIPDPEARRQVFPQYFRILLEHALRHGTVHTTPDLAAAALWLPTGQQGPLPPEDYQNRRTRATGPWVDRFAILDEALEAHHPARIPHHHLAILAVRPDQQGNGLGSALLDAHHKLLDDAHMPAYLEASGPGTREVYLRHGYTDHGAAVQLPDGPRMYPMWRQPRTRM